MNISDSDKILDLKMYSLQGKSCYNKFWYFMNTYVLVIPRFDLNIQGALFVVVLLQDNSYLLLRRDAGSGNLTSLNEHWVNIGAGIAECLLGTFLAWWGRSKRQYALTGWLTATALCGLFVLAFPFQNVNPVTVSLCGGEPVSSYSETDERLLIPRTIFLVATVVLSSLTMISIWAHGLTYLDDHEPQDGPYFYGILISIRLSLGLSGPNWLRPSAIRDDWWVPHLSISLLTLVMGLLLALFPDRMPHYKDITVTDNTGFWPSLRRIVRNKAIILESISLSLMYAALYGFIKRDKEYVQARFQIESYNTDLRTSRAVSETFRSLVVVMFVMIFRVRFSVRRSDGVKSNTAARVGGVVAIFAAIVFCVIAGLNCDLKDINGTVNGTLGQPTCSSECSCNSQFSFAPLCDLDTSVTYFSPCHAGCKDYQDLNGYLLFQNCSCAASQMARGSCTLNTCRSPFYYYQIFYALVIAICASASMMQGMVMLRAVKRHDKAIATGFAFACVGLGCQVIGHLLYVFIGEWICLYPGKNGSTCIYNRDTIWVVPAVSAVLAIGSAVTSIIASKIEEPAIQDIVGYGR